VGPGYSLDSFAGFCSKLILENGRSFEVEPFQRELLTDYFNGVRETLVLLPKKNGKTTLKAALALFHVITTPDAECVVAAASRDQAAILLRQAKGFVDRSPALAARLYVKDREIIKRDKRGRVRILAADADTADGIIPTLAIVDELHRAKSADMYGVFRDGLGPRDGQMLTISAAGDAEASVLGELRAAARGLEHQERDGKHLHCWSADGIFAMHEWALEADDDLDDLELVKMVNPASWQTVDELRRRHDSPSMTPSQWARFACGVWMTGETWWLSGEQVRGAALERAQLAPGEAIGLGFDGSRVGDATALVACRLSDRCLFPLGVWENPEPNDRTWEVPAGQVEDLLGQVMERYRVVRGYFDPPLWQTELDRWALEWGAPAVVPFSTNGKPMMNATERFRTDFAAGDIPHSGHPGLVRHMLNARIRDVRGGYFLTKERRTSPDKIDIAVASVLAYEAAMDALATGPVRPSRLVTFG
jgi:phage terminase large subunit-like protein